MKPTFRLVGLIVGAAALVALGVTITFVTFRRIENGAVAEQHARAVLSQAADLLSKLKDVESSMRGYVITGDTSYLEPYNSVKGQVVSDLAALRSLTAIPEADAHLTTIAPLMRMRLAHAERLIEARRTRGLAVAVQILSEGEGKRLMDALRGEMRAFQVIEEGAIARNEAVFQSELRGLFVLLLVISGLALLSAIAFTALFWRDARQRVRNLLHVETQRLLTSQEETSRQLQHANTTLQLSEERLAVTLDSIGDAVIATDAAGLVTQINPLAARLSGWTPALALGRPIDEILTLVNQETRLPSKLPVAETLARGTLQGLANHTVLISRDGHECPIADSCAPIRDREGRVLGAVLVFRDVTEEYATQQALRDVNSALGLARIEADRANLAKSDFLSNMSHEIRTPMNAIIGMSYLVLKSDLTPRQRDNLRTIQESGRHLLGIINDILDISKIEAGKLTVESTEFVLDEVLENVASLVVGKASAKGLELVFDVDKDVPAVLIGDPLRLGQILINYCNNAVKFTEKGEVSIVIRVKERTEHDVWLQCAVRDTGIGLSDEQMGRLFQSFSQADASTTRRFGGTGLGLVISKKLAELMGGEVGVESAVDVGSTFWFAARFGIGAERAQPSALTIEQRGMRVLVVDDNANARAVIAELLSSLTFDVDQAAGGIEAITAVSSAEAAGRPYSMVFLDWQMPGLDGIETARKLRELVLRRAPRMLMVTAYGREEVLEGAEEVGIAAVLIKPVSASALFDAVSRALGTAKERPRTSREVRAETLDRLGTIRGARILLVEDNDINQQVATALLREAGFEVDVAENGLVALGMVRTAAYDIVLMDMQMPVMDGVTATREIRKEARFAELPVVAMTANAMQADRDRCLAAGMNAHVAKPIEPEDLWSALLTWIRPRATATAGVEPPTNPTLRPGTNGAEELPTGVDGLDTVLGLHRGLGKVPLYLSMLRSFVAGQRGAAASTRDALDVDDWVSAERHAHTLKSAAATVGATGVEGLARLLESAIRERQSRAALDVLLGDLQLPLATLVTQLEDRLPVVKVRRAIAVVRLVLDAACDRLEALLAAGDAGAATLFQDQADLLFSAFPQEFVGMESAICGFEAESGLVALRAARALRAVRVT